MISGLAGDMTVAALLQISETSHEELSELFSEFFHDNVTLSVEETFVNGIKANRLLIDFSDNIKIHRDFATISDMITSSSSLPARVKNDAVEIFRIIAEAEGKIHGKDIKTVHFHEVGAVDSIIDIISTCYLINKINADSIEFSTPLLGSGTTHSAHGTIPIPSPATLEILKGLPCKRTNLPYELTTPTGAAILRYYQQHIENAFAGTIEKTAYSTGTQVFKDFPNLLRIILLSNEDLQTHNVDEIQTNIDDMPGEQMAYVMEELFAKGCLDAFFEPVFGKKSRPSYKLTVICKPEDTHKLSELILKETTTGGVRYSHHKRRVLNRSFEKRVYKGYPVNIKKFSGNGIFKIYPEYNDVAEVSRKTGDPFDHVYRAIIANNS